MAGRGMNIPPLAIIQARMGSKRLPGKVLLPLAGKPLIQHVWERTCEAFGKEHTVVAIPACDATSFLVDTVEQMGARLFIGCEENDVLGRFYECAHLHRWHPDSVIVRVTADDPFKDPAMMRRVADGARLDVERGAEAFTLAMLDAKYWAFPTYREHLTHILFGSELPPPPVGVWSIDTQEDYEAVKEIMERSHLVNGRWVSWEKMVEARYRWAQNEMAADVLKDDSLRIPTPWD